MSNFVGNSSLDKHSADSANFGHSQTPSLASSPKTKFPVKFAKNYESHTENTSVVYEQKGVELSKNTIDSKLICTNFFPARLGGASKSDSMRKFLPNTTIIALGGNLKNPIRTFKSLFAKFTRNAKIHILATSPIYKNPPFGFHNQPFFYNATMLLATSMCLAEFYAFIFYMERIFGRGRIRAFKNAPRTLDIDIIFFNDIFLRSQRLNIPHPKWRTRPSVLIPLIYQANYKGR